jgi:ABC-2 type transport system permease protein
MMSWLAADLRSIVAIAHREFASFYRLPVGWVVLALYLFLGSMVFALWTLTPGEPASLRGFFGMSGFLLLPVMPAVSMRLLSEELRSGTVESLLTAPVSDAAIVLGKFFGACAFLLTLLLPTLVFVVILHLASDGPPDPGPMLAGYLSLVLLGSLYLAAGTLVSSLTSNQTLAFLGTFLFLLMFLLVTGEIASNPAMPTWASKTLIWLSPGRRLEDLAKGLLDLSHIIYFLAGSGWFLALAIISLQSRRWR